MRNATWMLSIMCSFAAGCIGGFGGNGGTDGGTAAAYFDPDIQASLDILGCSSGGCHGDPGTPMHVVPPAQGGSVDANYAQVAPRTSGGAMSLLLTKPVQGNSIAHGGGKLVAPNSATFQQWTAWIKAGSPLRAAGTAGPPAAAPGDMANPPATTPPATGGLDMGACAPIKPTTKSSHNEGQECLTCHANGTDLQLRWTVAGTVWADSYGTTTRGGATVTVTDAKGVTIQMITDVQGNFYTTQAVSFPVTTSASACPNSKAMVAKSMTGSCNSAGCHDATRPLFLP
jgi:hypothetical protein